MEFLDRLTTFLNPHRGQKVVEPHDSPSLLGEINEPDMVTGIVEAMRVFDKEIFGERNGACLREPAGEIQRWAYKRQHDLGESVTHSIIRVSSYRAPGVIGSRTAARLECIQLADGQTYANFTYGLLDVDNIYHRADERTPRDKRKVSEMARLIIREYANSWGLGQENFHLSDF